MKILKLFACAALLVSATWAMGKNEIKPTMERQVQSAISILQGGGNSQSKASQIFALFDRYFDYRQMAALSLGNYYKTLTPAQQKEFSQLFEQKLKQNFIEKLGYYTDQTMIVQGISEPQGNRVHVKTVVKGKDKDYPINFKFFPRGGSDWVIYDVDVLGVSIIQSYKSQFGSLTQGGDFGAIMQRLRTSKAIAD